MKLIPLTQGLHAMVDDEDFEELNRFEWHANKTTTTWYAQGRPHGRRVAMHSFLTGLSGIDHRDGNGLNNQRANLRPATRGQNMQNRRAWGGSSVFKGVSANGSGWSARIGAASSNRQCLGTFRTQEEAARAYDAAARELYGPYAALNFARPGERSALTGELVVA